MIKEFISHLAHIYRKSRQLTDTNLWELPWSVVLWGTSSPFLFPATKENRYNSTSVFVSKSSTTLNIVPIKGGIDNTINTHQHISDQWFLFQQWRSLQQESDLPTQSQRCCNVHSCSLRIRKTAQSNMKHKRLKPQENKPVEVLGPTNCN